MGRKSGRNGAPAPQSRVSLSESKPEAYFCLLECVRSFLLGVFLRIRSRPFSLAVRSRAIFVCALCGSRALRIAVLRRRGRKNSARDGSTAVGAHRRGKLCRRFLNEYAWA